MRPQKEPEKEAQAERTVPEQLIIPAPLPEQVEIARNCWEVERASKRRGSSKLFPKATEDAVESAELHLRAEKFTVANPVERKWPNLSKQKHERLVCAANYSATAQCHSFTTVQCKWMPFVNNRVIGIFPFRLQISVLMFNCLHLFVSGNTPFRFRKCPGARQKTRDWNRSRKESPCTSIDCLHGVLA